MATGKLLTGNVSMSQGIKGYFSCCFNSHSRKSSDEDAQNSEPKNWKTDPTSKHDGYKGARRAEENKDNVDGSEKVSAYNYDDADTSSDSDDEVMRRYQQTAAATAQQQNNLARTPSNRSLKSAAPSERSLAPSHRSVGGASSRGGGSGGGGSVAGGTSVGGRSARSVGAASKQSSTRQATGGQSPGPSGAVDDELISLAEKGDIMAAVPTVGSSPYSSDDEGGSHKQHMMVSGADYSNEAFAATGSGGEEEERVPSSSEAGALSNTVSVSMGDVHDEHLFDVSDLDREPTLISKCGNLDVTFEYDAPRARMKVTIHNASDIPSKERGGASNTQIRLLLLPTKKIRHKTKIRSGENPVFDEAFLFKVNPEDVAQFGVRFRLYGCERMRRERMIGESVIGFAMVNLEAPTTHTLALEPRSNLSHGDSKLDVSSLLSRSDSASSSQSMQHGGMPELLIGMAYNATTGRLSVEVIKGSNFRNMAMNRAPDTYVKLTLMSPNGQEITRSKTSIRRGQPHPLFKETFMFQVALFQLADVTLMTSVYNKRSMKRKEMIGWFSLGYNNSGEEELAHWNDMRESKGEQVCRWHVLLEA